MKIKTLQDKLIASLKVHSSGKRTALRCGERLISYEELDRRSNYIAHWIDQEEIGSRDSIGVLVEDRAEFIVLMIGILKAGRIFMPLDPGLPGERLATMINSSDTCCVIGDSAVLTRLQSTNIMKKNNVRLMEIHQLFSHDHPSWWHTCPAIQYGPEDKIYIYFTSGTTGTPKAILGKNKSLIHFIQWELETFNIDETFNFSQFTNPCFDAFLRDILCPLCSGGTICIPAGSEVMLNPQLLAHWLDTSRIHLVHCTPALFGLLNAAPLTPQHFQALKFILLSGERIEPSTLVNWYRIFAGRIQLVNLWGTSETTMAKTCYFIQPQDVHLERIPVGKPIRGARVIVLDNDMNMCDDNMVGEIYIRTPYRTYGYHGDEQANRARFIPNPFNQDPDDLIHRTGDLGKILPNGNLEVLGRVDRQVKIRGIRIELEEIENTLLKHPGVKEAVVMKEESTNSKSNEFLYAYVTRGDAPGMTHDIDRFITGVKEYLVKKLPDYMVPAKIINRKSIPRTPNGKVDYETLAEFMRQETLAYEAPRDEAQRKLAQLWKEILGIEKIGIHNHFFELGGNSLNIMTLITRIHKNFDVKITLAEIFNNPTIEQQAEILKRAKPDIFLSLEKSEEKEYYALAPAQKRLYILQQANESGIVYNIPGFMIFSGKLDTDRLTETFKKLIHRHESLRTSFAMIGSEAVQKITGYQEIDFAVEYFQEGDWDNSTSLAGENPFGFIRPFALSRAPLFRVGLVKLAENRQVFMYDIHHIVTDGFSQTLFLQEFMDLFSGQELPPLSLRYRDYAQWQHKKKNQGLLKRQEEYWLEKFAPGVPVLTLAHDFPRPPRQHFAGSNLMLVLEPDTTTALTALAHREQVTLYQLLLALFNVLFSRLTHQETIILGADTSGRNHLELEHVIGMFVNTLVMINHPNKEKTFKEFLAEVKENSLEAFENQDYQFDDLVETLGLKKDGSRNPLFDIMFSFPEFEFSPASIPGSDFPGDSPLNIEPYDYEAKTSKFDMNIKIIKLAYSQKLGIDFEYDTQLFKASTIERYTHYFREIVRRVLDNTDIPLQDITISHELVEVESNITLTQLEF